MLARMRWCYSLNRECLNQKQLTQKLNNAPVWNTAELCAVWEPLFFYAPMVMLRRKSDGMVGSMLYQDTPRLYFAWQPRKPEMFMDYEYNIKKEDDTLKLLLPYHTD